jgi:hypothetical protein
MVSANKFNCHSPAPVQKPVQVQGSTSKEYSEDIGGAVSHNWECGRQEKRWEQATSSHARHCWDHSCECGLISSTEVCVTVSLRKWGISFDSMAHTWNRSTHASVQDPCLPVSDNCVPRKVDKVFGGIQWSLAAEPSHSGTRLVLNPCDCLHWGYLKDKVISSALRTEGEDQRKLCTGHKRNAHPCCTELCITSSSGLRVPRGSHQACHPECYPYVKF